MTPKDAQLIRQALDVPYTSWHDVRALIPQADTDEARDILRSIESSKYHTDEYFASM